MVNNDEESHHIPEVCLGDHCRDIVINIVC